MKAEDAKRLIKFLVEDGNPLWATALCTERNFACPNDWYALCDKLEKKGMWLDFYYWASSGNRLVEMGDVRCSSQYFLWLTRLTDDKGEPHAAQLVADYLKTFTCYDCDAIKDCKVAWDSYNQNGDCLNK